ncbi:MmyB family transcriptional regulator [Actinacidiphila yanglinensis]|uniref:MmyB family transcriptional regulator n=1 Tax=Actinacidiphila yanglinensis TaxID=310779 RepID=UPI001F448E8F|nr:hypothetical protein [Actinacidiphila yanglinensis]
MDTLQQACRPAFVLGRRLDVLAHNPLAGRLITDFRALPAAERNQARFVFLDPHARELYLGALVGELSIRSQEFRRPQERPSKPAPALRGSVLPLRTGGRRSPRVQIAVRASRSGGRCEVTSCACRLREVPPRWPRTCPAARGCARPFGQRPLRRSGEHCGFLGDHGHRARYSAVAPPAGGSLAGHGRGMRHHAERRQNGCPAGLA